MTRAQKAAIAKALYVGGHSIEEIASILGVSKRTIHNYKTKQWDEEKAQTLLQKSDEKLYSNFLEYMHAFLKEIKESNLKPDVKAEKIAQIGDSFAKMRKIAALEDPQAYTLAIVKQTLQKLLEAAANKMQKQCLEELISLIDLVAEELSDVTL